MPERKTRKIDKFLEVPAVKRRNPKSVRRLLFQFIEEAFDKDCVPAAAALSKAPRGSLSRSYQMSFSGEVLYNLTRDEKSASYTVLDAFARYHGVPLSLVLIFTRIHSELDDPNRRFEGHHLSTISALKAALAAIEEAAINSDPDPDAHRQFDYALFKRIQETYHETYQEREGEKLLPF